MSLYYRWIFVLFFACGFAVNVWSAGSGGIRVETPDAGAFGKGSAFVGEANTPAAIYYNPAGLNQITQTSVTLGTAVIFPSVKYKNLSGNTTRLERENFIVPNFFGAVPIVANKFTLGVGSGSYWGLGSHWAEDSELRYLSTDSSIRNADTMLTAAYQVSDQWSFAISADNDYSVANLNKKFNNPYDAVGDGNLQFKAKDSSWGYRIATMFKLNDQHQFGLMYRSPISHKYEGKVYVDNIGANLAGALSFASDTYETKVTQKMMLPQSVVLGYSFKPNSKWTFNFDLEWMDWSSFERGTLTFPDEANANRLSFLNTGNPTPYDWTAAWSESMGVEYAAMDNLRLRAGYYHHQKVGSQDNFTPAIMDTGSHGITTGLGYDINAHLTFDLAYSLIIYEARKVDSALAPSGTNTINGTYSEITHVGMASLTYKF